MLDPQLWIVICQTNPIKSAKNCLIMYFLNLSTYLFFHANNVFSKLNCSQLKSIGTQDSLDFMYHICSNTICTFYFPKWLFGALSIQIKCKFAHSIQEYCQKTGLLTQKCVFYCNFNNVRIQFKPSSVLERIRYTAYEIEVRFFSDSIWNIHEY